MVQQVFILNYFIMKKFKLTESELTKLIQNVIKEDSDTDRPDNWRELPGYNPEYFYGDGSLDKLRKLANSQEESMSMSKEDLTQVLVEIYSLLQDNAPDIASRRLEGILYKLGALK